MKQENVMRFAMTLSFIWIIVWLAAVTGTLYVIHHFIAKAW